MSSEKKQHEHVLVCLSSSPANERLIRRAAQAHRAEVIAGAELFPAMAELMADGLVHPGNLGHRLYATRLAARLQALGLA